MCCVIRLGLVVFLEMLFMLIDLLLSASDHGGAVSNHHQTRSALC